MKNPSDQPLQWGVSYYPELTPEAEWPRDLDLMRQNGMEVVRINEFAWTYLEPREGEYDFAWLDRFIEQVHHRGLKVILGTPTAAPPAWFIQQYPQSLCVLEGGQRVLYGERRNVCINHTVFRHFVGLIVSRLGDRYGSHPAVVGWQIDNELVGPERREQFLCHCDDCQWRFRDWLKQRYGTIAAINDAWGLGFWSLRFSDFGEVITPQGRRCLGHTLDGYRFYSDANADFIRLQREVLRARIAPGQFISHNSTGVFDRGIDHRAYARQQDCTGWDAYLGAAAAGHPLSAPFTALAHDMFRSALHLPFWIYETNVNRQQNVAALAEMRARGACGIIFWHWRRHRAGVEQSAAAICDHDGQPNPDVLAVITEAQRLLANDRLPSCLQRRRAALVFSPDGVRAVHLKPTRPIPYLHALITAYHPLWRHGIVPDVVGPDESMDDYALVIMPALSLLGSEQADALQRFVHGGGVLLVIGPTAYTDMHGVCFRRRGEPLFELLGIRIRESHPKASAVEVHCSDGVIRNAQCAVEHIENDSAEVLATMTCGDEQLPAVVRRPFGKGHVYYSAVQGEALQAWVSELAATAAGLSWHDNPHEDVAVIEHLSGDGRLWLINHASEPRSLLGCTIPSRSVVLRD
jgi:beta-galactosidase